MKKNSKHPFRNYFQMTSLNVQHLLLQQSTWERYFKKYYFKNVQLGSYSKTWANTPKTSLFLSCMRSGRKFFTCEKLSYFSLGEIFDNTKIIHVKYDKFTNRFKYRSLQIPTELLN